MSRRIKIQTYRARYAAERYAREIMANFDNCKAVVVPTNDFRNAVQVTKYENGQWTETALAGRRPAHYGRASQAPKGRDKAETDTPQA